MHTVGRVTYGSGAASQATSQVSNQDAINPCHRPESGSGEGRQGLSYDVFDNLHSPDTFDRSAWSLETQQWRNAPLLGCTLYMEKLRDLDMSFKTGMGTIFVGLVFSLAVVAAGPETWHDDWWEQVGIFIVVAVTAVVGGVAMGCSAYKMWHYYTVWTVRQGGQRHHIRVDKHTTGISITRLTPEEADKQRDNGTGFAEYQNLCMASACARYAQSSHLVSPTWVDLQTWLNQEASVPYDITAANCQHFAQDMWAKFTHADHPLTIHMDYNVDADRLNKAVNDRPGQPFRDHHEKSDCVPTPKLKDLPVLKKYHFAIPHMFVRLMEALGYDLIGEQKKDMATEEEVNLLDVEEGSRGRSRVNFPQPEQHPFSSSNFRKRPQP